MSVEEKEPFEIYKSGHPEDVHNAEFKRINARLKELDIAMKAFQTADANHTASLERIHEKLDDWKEQTKAITDLGYSVRSMVTQLELTQDHIVKILDKQQKQDLKIHDIENGKYNEKFDAMESHMISQDKAIEELKNKPGVVALKYLDKAFSYLLIALLGLIIVAVGYYITNKPGG